MQKLLNDVGKQLSEEITLSGDLDEMQADKYSQALNKLQTHLVDLQRAKALEKKILHKKTIAQKRQEPKTLMEKLQDDAEQNLLASLQEKMKDEAELSKTAKKKLGLITRTKKRKPKEKKK